ncbi:MAG TPA: hypothetical protein PLT23_10170, partial [Lentisphaeria bacterium]|nr:hypothetical protein [Lentisphaeria bacterium]
LYNLFIHHRQAKNAATTRRPGRGPGANVHPDFTQRKPNDDGKPEGHLLLESKPIQFTLASSQSLTGR